MPESYIHLDFKSDLYWDIIQADTYAEVEKGMGRTRTDVLTEIGDHLVAIEIQHTRIPIKSILRRMREHTALGAHTLWLITPEALEYGNDRCRNVNWINFIQIIQNGVIFLPGKNQTAIPARVDNTLKFHKDEIVAGRKFLDQQEPIELENLRFEKNDQFGLNITTYDEWWVKSTLDLLY